MVKDLQKIIVEARLRSFRAAIHDGGATLAAEELQSFLAPYWLQCLHEVFVKTSACGCVAGGSCLLHLDPAEVAESIEAEEPHLGLGNYVSLFEIARERALEELS